MEKVVDGVAPAAPPEPPAPPAVLDSDTPERLLSLVAPAEPPEVPDEPKFPPIPVSENVTPPIVPVTLELPPAVPFDPLAPPPPPPPTTIASDAGTSSVQRVRSTIPPPEPPPPPLHVVALAAPPPPPPPPPMRANRTGRCCVGVGFVQVYAAPPEPGVANSCTLYVEPPGGGKMLAIMACTGPKPVGRSLTVEPRTPGRCWSWPPQCCGSENESRQEAAGCPGRLRLTASEAPTCRGRHRGYRTRSRCRGS